MLSKIRNFIIGKPLATKAIAHERLSNGQGLAIFSADALSSTAYATEEILLVLAVAGVGALFSSIYIAVAISLLIILVSFSYRQVIFAYPQGGGVYSVARENLGEFPSLIGAASLLIDYVLTAAVSVTAGVAAITSAVPALYDWRVSIGVGIIVFLTWGNLRGVRESGKLFSVPTYTFIFTFLAMIGYGIVRFALGGFPAAVSVQDHSAPTETLALFLLLRAFASGCAAMTGIEATSNGVQAFRQPESKNAAKTLMAMALLLAVIFSGLTLLSYWTQVMPKHGETVVSQIAETLFGRGPLYFAIQGITALILILAANTPFAGFPRVASQIAKDGYFPRQFLNLGSKLVFANGILILSGFAVFLICFFGGNVHALIPLYAIGVFLGFSLSQFGMVKHWLKLGQGTKFRKNIAINALGGVATVIVCVIVFFSKFSHGAWLLFPAIILIVMAMKKIKSHYSAIEKALNLEKPPLPEICVQKTMVLLVSEVNDVTAYVIRFAQSFQPVRLRAVHVAVDREAAKALKNKWERNIPDVPLDILFSEYRDLIEPILDYLKKIDEKWKKDMLIVVMPEIIPPKFWHRFLHNQTAPRIRLAIEQDPEINAEILEVPVKIGAKMR